LGAEKVFPSELVQLHLFSKLTVTAALALLIWKIKSKIMNAVGIKMRDFFAELRLIKTKKKAGNG
jgi:hypothetical protein